MHDIILCTLAITQPINGHFSLQKCQTLIDSLLYTSNDLTILIVTDDIPYFSGYLPSGRVILVPMDTTKYNPMIRNFFNYNLKVLPMKECYENYTNENALIIYVDSDAIFFGLNKADFIPMQDFDEQIMGYFNQPVDNLLIENPVTRGFVETVADILKADLNVINVPLSMETCYFLNKKPNNNLNIFLNKWFDSILAFQDTNTPCYPDSAAIAILICQSGIRYKQIKRHQYPAVQRIKILHETRIIDAFPS